MYSIVNMSHLSRAFKKKCRTTASKRGQNQRSSSELFHMELTADTVKEKIKR